MAGVTTAIVAFIFVCVIFPHLVRHRTQFHVALGAVILIVLLDSMAGMVYRDAERGGGFHAFAYAMTGLLQIVAILALFFSAGGVSPREMVGEMKRAIEVIRRGEEEKEVIIPIGEQRRAPRGPGEAKPAEDERVVYTINDDEMRSPESAPPGPGAKTDEKGPLPLD